jgi:crotonobetaine/carnitine-CoA ligase
VTRTASTPASLPELVLARAEADADALFVADPANGYLTYAELSRRATRWAAAFLRAGVVAGDTVVTMVPNGVEALALWTGLAWMRAVEVPVNNELRGGVLGHVLRTSSASTIVVAPELVDALATADDHQPLRVVVASDDPADVCAAAERLPAGRTRGLVSRAEALADVEPESSLAPPAWHDTACVLFTSGTTGRSKGVVIPWGNLHASANGSLPVDDLGPDDCWYGPGSASHVGAKSMPLLFALVGGRIVLRERFSTSRFWDDVREHGVTSTVMVSTLAHYLYSQPAKDDDADTTLRNVLMVPVIPQIDEFNRRFGTRTCTVFNMTELSVPICSGWDVSDWRSCGRLRIGPPGYQVRLVDDADYDVPVGVTGQLVARADVPWTTGQGYLGDAGATAAAFRNGWFHTGDLLRQDADGRYFFVDRLTDSIRVRGENVSSFEVEAEVNEHPSVAESAAVAVPAKYGEDDIKVFVVPRTGVQLAAEDVLEFLRPRMARFMLPRFVEIVPELPKNWRLRVRKDVLRALAATSQQESDR